METEEKCGGKKKKERKTRKETCRCIYACADEKWTSYEIRSRSKKIVKFEAAGCGTRTQIQDEVVLRSKPNFAKVAGALSCRIPFLPGEYRDRCFRVVEHPRCISFPLESSTFPPLFPLFIYLLIVRRSLRGSVQDDIKLQENSRHSYTRFLEGEIERERDRKHTQVYVYSGSRYLVELEDRESVRFHRWCVCER